MFESFEQELDRWRRKQLRIRTSEQRAHELLPDRLQALESNEQLFAAEFGQFWLYHFGVERAKPAKTTKPLNQSLVLCHANAAHARERGCEFYRASQGCLMF